MPAFLLFLFVSGLCLFWIFVRVGWVGRWRGIGVCERG